MEKTSPISLAEGLSPLEIKNKEFKKTVMGYSPTEVVEFLDRTAKTWETVQRHEKSLFDEIRSLNEEIGQWKSREKDLELMREEVQKEVAKIKENAIAEAEEMLTAVKERADEIRGKTEAWLENVLKEIEDTQRRKTSFITAFKSALDQHYALLNTDESSTTALPETLSAFLKQTEKKRTPEAEHSPELSH